MQQSGTLTLTTSREGEVRVACAGAVKLENGTLVGDVDLLEEDRFRLEAAISALTECLTKHAPATYEGEALSDGAPQRVSQRVHIAALAGKHVRFTSLDASER